MVDIGWHRVSGTLDLSIEDEPTSLATLSSERWKGGLATIGHDSRFYSSHPVPD